LKTCHLHDEDYVFALMCLLFDLSSGIAHQVMTEIFIKFVDVIDLGTTNDPFDFGVDLRHGMQIFPRRPRYTRLCVRPTVRPSVCLSHASC